MRRYGRPDIARNQRFSRSVIVKAIARIARHLEIVNHHDGRWASAKDDVNFFGKRQVIGYVAVRIKVKEQRAVA